MDSTPIIDPRTVIYDAPVVIRKEVLFQRIMDYVRKGYVHYACGSVPVHKAPALALKFRDYYHVHIDRNLRFRRKRAGLANAELFLYSEPNTNADVLWVLLVTGGEHPAFRSERLKDVRESGQRLVLTGYELVQLPRHGSSAAAWTWRIEKEQIQTWRYRLKTLIRGRAHEDLRKAWWSLTNPPGLAGIRAQTRKLMAFAKREWARSRSKSEPWPFHGPIRLSYLRRVEHTTRPLTALLRERMNDRLGDPRAKSVARRDAAHEVNSGRPIQGAQDVDAGSQADWVTAETSLAT